METATKTERGSAKVFSLGASDHDGISKAIGVARGSYSIKRWWKYGQPQIDRIHAVLETPEAALGTTVIGLMKLNAENLQVSTECFPLGTVRPDLYQVNVEIGLPV